MRSVGGGTDGRVCRGVEAEGGDDPGERNRPLRRCRHSRGTRGVAPHASVLSYYEAQDDDDDDEMTRR